MELQQQASSSRNPNARLQRNIKEKERRMKMKNLYSQLASVIHPQQHPQPPVPELIDQATNYINHLRGRIENLEQLRDFHDCIFDESTMITCPAPAKKPSLDVQSWDSSEMAVSLTCGSGDKSVVFECFRIFQEEGADVTDFTFLNFGDSAIYMFKAKAIIVRIGIDTSRIHERLKELIHL